MKTLLGLLTLGALGALATPATTQTVSYTVITPPGTFEQAIGMSPNGEYVCGSGGSNGFIWSEAGGLQTGFGFPVESWGVSDDGMSMSGTFLNGMSQSEGGVWTAGGGAALQGSPFGSGCGSDVSHLFGLDADGDVSVGMAWDGCRTSPVRWTPGTGMTAMVKQDPTSSARAHRVSGDGLIAVGWDQGLPTGQGFSRRACVWTTPTTQIFPLTTPGNPQGLGEVTDVNSDGTVFCGTVNNNAFRWIVGSEPQTLEPVAGLGGQYFANGISDDGSVSVGVRLQFPVADGVIWTPTGGAMLMVDFLAANGITVSATDVRNCTDVSADGTRICGWGNNGAWVVDLDVDDDPWVDLGGASVGIAGEPLLDVTGDLTTGSTLTLDVSNAPSGALMVGWLSFTSVPLDFFGGTIYANPQSVQIVRIADGAGNWSTPLNWPPGVAPGIDLFLQFLVQDASVPDGITLSNAMMAVTP